MSAQEKIAVLGSGSWGTALGCAMVRAGHQVVIWGRNGHIVDEINQDNCNSEGLPGIKLEPELTATNDLAEAVEGAKIILLVTPAQTIGEMVEALGTLIQPDQMFITCAKGIDRETGKTPAELMSAAISPTNIGALSGPSFASDVAHGLPTAVTLAFDNMATARTISSQLSSDSFRIYANDDLMGVELGGALKNVLALAVGAARGMKLGASAEAALIARGFGELQRLAGALGATQNTLSGLSGLGDLVLTASSTQSRNFSYGMALGSGENIRGLPLAEGAFTAHVAAELAAKHKIDAPVIASVSAVIDGKITAQQAVQQLLSRPLKAETE